MTSSSSVSPPAGSRRRGLAAAGVDAKKLPHNLDAEQSILGGILIRNEVLGQLDDLETEDFYDHRNKVVFGAIRSLQAVGRPIDVVTLEVEIERQEKLDAIGGMGFLGELALRVPTADNVVAYRDAVQLAARNRRVILALASATERAMNWPHDPEELIAEVAGELQRFDEHRRGAAVGLRWTKPMLDYLGAAEPDDDDAEDWIVRDLVPRVEPWLFGGPAKAGKTWTAIDLCIALALGLNWLNFKNTMGRPVRVMAVFREDGRRRLHKRLWELCRGRGVSLHDPVLLENLRISREPLYLPNAKDERRLIDEAKAFRADVIVIDNLTRVMVGDSSDERDVKAFSQSWGLIVEETGAATGFLHHVRKGGTERGGDPFDSLRGAGDILGFARHALVVTPRRDDDEKLCEVRMRGNLDLDREGFVLGFDRRYVNNRWQAVLHDRGAIDEQRQIVAEVRKEKEVEIKRQQIVDKLERQIQYAIELATRDGNVTKQQVAIHFGKSASNTMNPAFELAVKQGRLVQCKGSERNLGFRLPSATQKGLL